jgi:bifunctional non-homologous end joining protein LigD
MKALKPMLATDGKGHAFPSGDGWRQEPKLDGWRFLFHVQATGVTSVAGRNGSDRTGQPAAIEEALAVLPNDTILDAELVVPGEKSPRVSHSLAHGGPLQAIVFDCLRVGGQDITNVALWERRLLLEKLSELFVDPVFLIPQMPSPNVEVHESWVRDGVEGSVLKREDSTYELGRRSRSWFKFKPQVTEDAVVIGFQPGKGKWADYAGAFEIKMIDGGVETTCATGTDATRQEINDTPDKYLGKIIEVAHHGRMDSGKPRHPVFVRLREDLEGSASV